MWEVDLEGFTCSSCFMSDDAREWSQQASFCSAKVAEKPEPQTWARAFRSWGKCLSGLVKPDSSTQDANLEKLQNRMGLYKAWLPVKASTSHRHKLLETRKVQERPQVNAVCSRRVFFHHCSWLGRRSRPDMGPFADCAAGADPNGTCWRMTDFNSYFIYWAHWLDVEQVHKTQLSLSLSLSSYALCITKTHYIDVTVTFCLFLSPLSESLSESLRNHHFCRSVGLLYRLSCQRNSI